MVKNYLYNSEFLAVMTKQNATEHSKFFDFQAVIQNKGNYI